MVADEGPLMPNAIGTDPTTAILMIVSELRADVRQMRRHDETQAAVMAEVKTHLAALDNRVTSLESKLSTTDQLASRATSSRNGLWGAVNGLAAVIGILVVIYLANH